MDFLNKAVSQVSELFQSMTPAARITSGLLLAVVAISLAYLFQNQMRGGSVYLLDGAVFTQSEIAAMQSAFGAAGLNDWSAEGNRLRVPLARRHDYLAALADKQAFPQSYGSVFEKMIANNSWFESSAVRQMKLKHAIERELSLVISKMSDVEEATVRYDETKSGGFPMEVEKRAMVAARGKGSKPLDETLVRTIRDTMVGSIAGIKPENVTILDQVANRSHAGNKIDGTDNVYAADKRMYQQRWERQIYKVLSVIPGVIVGVNVELDPEVASRSDKVKIDPQTVTVAAKTTSESTTNRGSTVGGRPGAEPNVAGPGNSRKTLLSGTPSESTLEKQSEDVASVVSQEKTVTQVTGMRPKDVTATVSVPNSYFVKVFQQRNKPAEGEEPVVPDAAQLESIKTEIVTSIEEQVVGLLPPSGAGVDRYTKVKVTTYQDLPAEPLQGPGVGEQATAWLAGNWQTLGLLGVGVFCLMMLRSMVRSTQTPAPSSAAASADGVARLNFNAGGEDATAEDEEEALGEEGAATPSSMLRRYSTGGPSLKDELTTMVKEDPDAAANVLRNWIGEAA